MLIVFGLGNPGKIYENTYHNAGALVLRRLLEEFKNTFGPLGKTGNFSFSRGIDPVTGEKLIFVWTNTYMNESGFAVRDALKFFKARANDMAVIHDDSDMNLGISKVSASPNAAGHNGILSVQNELGIKIFRRLKIGIRNPKEKKHRKAKEFVLKVIPKNKLGLLYPKNLISNWLLLQKKS
jgi:PTH1 family peptidyl-tRNA hydrolase